MVFWVFFDKKQGKFCQNLVALFPFAAKIVGAQKNPLHSVQSAQNQCQKILISVVTDKRKHTPIKQTIHIFLFLECFESGYDVWLWIECHWYDFFLDFEQEVC